MIINYFEIFGLQPTYNLDLELLRNKYLELQISLAKPVIPGMNSHSYSITDINTAYKILRDPLSRAEYMLNLKGIDIESTSLQIGVSKSELEHIWQEYEHIETLKDPNLLKEQRQALSRKEQGLMKQIQLAFNIENFNDVIDSVIKFKYLIKLKESVDRKCK